ncbi:hypothetical protein SNE40_019549 [Patella caerulea]|uniref:TGF-beta-activated kinase 1 and MAP3K7-binding protein 1 n=1 Tax=Patella caerulea TaxID=87958 RepID=A0AAN8J9M5_PATCE
MTSRTRTSIPSAESVGSPPRFGLQGHALSWTDDLPVCHFSGVGFSTNQIYREDGERREEHDFEDKSFHFKSDDECYLYGVFDGHNGNKVSNFAAQRMPAELLLGQLQDKETDHEIKEVLKQAFAAVEQGCFESMDDLLAQKATCQMELPEGLSDFDAYQKYPEIMNKLHALETQISGGTTACVVLIYNNKLYVANVGDTRALLCTTSNGVLKVMQLSHDHTLADEQEQIRLVNLGLDVEKLKQLRKLGTSDNTRCIGDYHVKGGYKDIDILSAAIREPVIAEPYLDGGIALDDSCSFLIIMSDGLYQSLEDAFQCERVNVEIATMVAEEFPIQTTLNGVAQAVVDRVVRKHHDAYMTGHDRLKLVCQKRDDITLMIRNFNYPLAGAATSPTMTRANHVSVPYNNRPSNLPPILHIPGRGTPPSYHTNNGYNGTNESSPITPTNAGLNPYGNNNDTQRTNTSGTYSTESTESSEDRPLFNQEFNAPKLELDKDGRVGAYIDFTDFYKAIDELSDAQQESLNDDMKPKSGYEPIKEESESPSSPEH